MHTYDTTCFRRALRLLLGLLLLGLAGYAQAGFGTCANRTYLQRFDARLHGYECVVLRQSGLVTPEGPRRIRLLHHRAATPAPAMAAQLVRGMEAAVATLPRIGRYAVYDVSILLVHDVPAPPDAMAAAEGVTRTGAATAECQVTMYLRALPPEEAASTLAHELFHCVQAATFSPGQNRSYDGAGVWWTEGSAEWFASLVLPDASSYQALADTFASTIGQRPLYRQDYTSLVFFLWLAQREGPERVMWFLAGMPQAPSEQAQRVALRDALDDAQWLQFGRDLADGRIRRPHGPSLRVSLAVRRPPWTWDRNRSDRLSQAPFTVAAVVATLDCGLWETRVVPGRLYASRPPLRDGGAWATLPASIDARGGDDRYLHLVTNTGDTPLEHRFEVRQQAGCARCGESTRTDACVVGTWRETGGGAAAWLQQNMPANVRFRASRSAARMTFRADGVFVTDEVSATVYAQPDRDARREGEAHAQASGRWSADEGRLHLCTDRQQFRGEIRRIDEHGTMRAPLPAAPAGDTRLSYTCQGSTLRTEVAIPGGRHPPLRTTYTREQ